MAPEIGFRSLLGVEVPLDGHKSLERAEIDNHRHAAHSPFPALRHIPGEGIDIEIELADIIFLGAVHGL